MQVSNEVDQELESLARDRIVEVTALLNPLAEQVRGVTYGPENVHVLGTFPSLRAREGAQLRGVICDSVDVVHLRGPPHLAFVLVSP